MPKQIPVAIYRGGTSRALFFHKSDLPDSIEEQDELVLNAFGSGHPLQIDGLGGGNPLTSKCAVIGPSTVSGADVDYTFLYPAVETRMVDRKGNCGNISSAVGPFAVNGKLVPATGDTTSVLIHNTNTRSLLRATFTTRDGRFFPDGDFSIDGVPGTGSRIALEFLGDSSQPLLPTGNVLDQLEIPELGRAIDVTILRAGNLTVFCKMENLEISGDPDTWLSNEVLWQKMEAVRGAGRAYRPPIRHPDGNCRACSERRCLGSQKSSDQPDRPADIAGNRICIAIWNLFRVQGLKSKSQSSWRKSRLIGEPNNN